ncbi:MAG: ATP-binding cassette domain-containing protein [Ignavibacteriaceae bacterium]
MLEIKNLTSGYTKNNDILKEIDLTINDDEVVAIVGQNGSGKSTFAKLFGLIPSVILGGCMTLIVVAAIRRLAPKLRKLKL